MVIFTALNVLFTFQSAMQMIHSVVAILNYQNRIQYNVRHTTEDKIGHCESHHFNVTLSSSTFWDILSAPEIAFTSWLKSIMCIWHLISLSSHIHNLISIILFSSLYFFCCIAVLPIIFTSTLHHS